LLAATAMLVASASASAAVTIGQTGNPSGNCSSSNNYVQSGIAGPPGYAVPAGFGVITSWSFRGSGSGKLVVWRPTALFTFIVVGKSGAETFDPAAVKTYPTQIPVQPNDLLGMRITGDGKCLLTLTDNGDAVRFNITASDPPDGSTQSLNVEIPNVRIAVAASVEPDCDADGLGDETQDTDLSSCAPGTIPPPAPGAVTATCKGLPATIVGTEGDDVRTGSQGRDVIAGLGGNDTLSGFVGNDVICGGAGKDKLKGGKGNDFLSGQKGNDTLKGGKGKDSLLGQKGKDALNGGPSRDFCKGGKGNDTASKCEVEKSI